jgi:hypothetical protein
MEAVTEGMVMNKIPPHPDEYWLKLAVNEARYQESLLRSDVLYRLNQILEELEERKKSYYTVYSEGRRELNTATDLIKSLIEDMEPKNA